MDQNGVVAVGEFLEAASPSTETPAARSLGGAWPEGSTCRPVGCLPVTDAAVLTKMAGEALLVVVDRIHRPQLEQAIASLGTAGAVAGAEGRKLLLPARSPREPQMRAPSAEWVAVEPNTSWCCEVSGFDNPAPELRAA